MSKPQIHGISRPYSASRALEAIAAPLLDIKIQDHLTWADLGAVLGKSDDQAAKYADASAAMDIVTFGRGKVAWGSRFTGPFNRLCTQARPAALCDNEILSCVIEASLEIAKAKASGNRIDQHEIDASRSALEAARDAIDELLRKGRS